MEPSFLPAVNHLNLHYFERYGATNKQKNWLAEAKTECA